MTRLVDDLLSLSKLEVKERLKPEGVIELEPLIKNSALMLGQSAASYKNRVKIHGDGVIPPLHGNHDEVTEVFQNLLENALKYSTPDTDALVQIRPLDTSVEVKINDQGEGVVPKYLERLTEQFTALIKGVLVMSVARGLVFHCQTYPKSPRRVSKDTKQARRW